MLELLDRSTFGPLLGIFAIGVALALSSPYPFVLSMIALGLLFAFARWHHLLLLFIPFGLWATDVFFAQFGGSLQPTFFGVLDLVRSVALVLLIGFGLSYKELCKQAVKDAERRAQEPIVIPGARGERSQLGHDRSQHESSMVPPGAPPVPSVTTTRNTPPELLSRPSFHPMSGIPLSIVVGVLLTIGVVWWFPFPSIRDASLQTFFLPGEQVRLFLMTICIGFAVILIDSLISYLGWRRISPIQAALFMLRVYSEQQGREHQLIERRLFKLRKRLHKKGSN